MNPDLDIAAPLIVRYYEWLSGNGSSDPETILSTPLTAAQRELVLQGMEDVNVVWSLTAPLREEGDPCLSVPEVETTMRAGPMLN